MGKIKDIKTLLDQTNKAFNEIINMFLNSQDIDEEKKALYLELLKKRLKDYELSNSKKDG